MKVIGNISDFPTAQEEEKMESEVKTLKYTIILLMIVSFLDLAGWLVTFRLTDVSGERFSMLVGSVIWGLKVILLYESWKLLKSLRKHKEIKLGSNIILLIIWIIYLPGFSMYIDQLKLLIPDFMTFRVARFDNDIDFFRLVAWINARFFIAMTTLVILVYKNKINTHLYKDDIKMLFVD